MASYVDIDKVNQAIEIYKEACRLFVSKKHMGGKFDGIDRYIEFKETKVSGGWVAGKDLKLNEITRLHIEFRLPNYNDGWFCDVFETILELKKKYYNTSIKLKTQVSSDNGCYESVFCLEIDK